MASGQLLCRAHEVRIDPKPTSLPPTDMSKVRGFTSPTMSGLLSDNAPLSDQLRTASQQPDDDAMVVEVMQKMIKQRRESIALYEQGGRAELAAVEAAELAIIEDFLPAQLSDAETSAAIEDIKAELGAESLKDMGRVMATLKERHGPQLDMSKASGLVKAALS